jgi:hypothetical protein
VGGVCVDFVITLVELHKITYQELKCSCSSARVLGQEDVREAYKV